MSKDDCIILTKLTRVADATINWPPSESNSKLLDDFAFVAAVIHLNGMVLGLENVR